MNDQERITDLILTEKKMTTNYDTFASECVNTKLRDDFLRILGEEHMIQTDLFQKAQSKGWYQVEPAPASKIQTAAAKFQNQKPQ